MHKIGLKIWSTNDSYIAPALDLYSQKIFDYIEIYVVPNSESKFLSEWKKVNIPIILHAPHSHGGLNLSLSECESKNRELIREVDLYHKALKPKYVIFHPGTNGTLEETIRQIQLFKDEFSELFDRVVLENKPKIGIKGEDCIGATPEEINRALEETGLGFCYDIGHSICYSAWKKVDYKQIMDQFIALEPKIYHLSDGDITSEKDMHLNFGEGNFDLEYILSKIPEDTYLSIETNKRSQVDLDDFKMDVEYLRKCRLKV